MVHKMKKKHIALAILLCVIVALLILGISNLRNKEDDGVSNSNGSNSATVDDPTKVEDEDSLDEDIVEDEIDLWIKPSENTEEETNSSTNVGGSGNSKEDKESSESNSSETEEDNREENDSVEDEDSQEEEKPEWIGGDF